MKAISSMMISTLLSLLLCIDHYGRHASAFLIPQAAIPRAGRLPSSVITTKSAAITQQRKNWMAQYLLSNADIDEMLANNNKTNNDSSNNQTSKEKELVQELETLTTQFESVSNTLQSNTQLYNTTLLTLQNEITSLQTELVTTKAQLSESQTLLAESLNHVQELEDESQSYQDSLLKKAEEEQMQNKVNSIMEDMRSEIVHKDEVIDHLNFTLQRMEKKYGMLEEEMMELKKKKESPGSTTTAVAKEDTTTSKNLEQEKRDLFIEREKFRRLYTQQLQKEEKVKLQEEAEYQALVENIAKLEDQIGTYEKERKSMRKLTVLGLKRVGSLLAFWRLFGGKNEGAGGDNGKEEEGSSEEVVVGVKKDIVDAKDGGGI